MSCHRSLAEILPVHRTLTSCCFGCTNRHLYLALFLLNCWTGLATCSYLGQSPWSHHQTSFWSNLISLIHRLMINWKLLSCLQYCGQWSFFLLIFDPLIKRIQFNSLAPGGFDYSLKLVNFKLISMIDILSISLEITIRWMPQHLTEHKSTLVQVMAWCRQAPSHYLSQCWPRSLSPYDVTRPQWVNKIHVWCDDVDGSCV